MPKKAMEQLTESMFYVLMALRQAPMCGIEIGEWIEIRTASRVRPGPATLYTVLGKFLKEGYIDEIKVDGRKRTYRITPTGISAYEHELSRLLCCVSDARREDGKGE